MKRTRSYQLKSAPSPPPPQDADAGNHPKPQRRAKQPRQQPKGGNEHLAATPGAPDEAAPVVPDVVVSPRASGWEEEDDLDDAGLGLSGGGAWWSWGVDEDKLLGWFPFVEEDFRRCPGERAGDAEVDFDDDDIWRIHQIHEIPNYAATK